MRKWAYLREPYPYDNEVVYKVMIHTDDDGTYVYLFNSKMTQISFMDEWYEDVMDALDEWDARVIPNSWVEIDDPIEGCQYDAVLPIRVKGRNVGKPQWGKYEQFVNGCWIEYKE